MELSLLQQKVIRWDIKSQGVYLPSLQEDLFDHICCLLEEEMKADPDFKTAYIRARNKIGSLAKLQYQTDQEINSHRRLERFIIIPHYLAIILYFFLGLSMLFGPVLLAIIELNAFYGVFAIPFIIMGYMIVFKRINYRKFDVIPYKESLSPVQMIF